MYKYSRESIIHGGFVKMGKVSLSVDFNKPDGVIRAVNGANLAPPTYARSFGSCNLDMPFKELNIPITRLHDSPYDNPGQRLVDIQHIFGNWDADVNDPGNYYFRQTDDHIRNCLELGTKIIYRLGTTIEHSIDHYYACPPQDFDKWADICINIIRHYNEGWNSGFEWNIEYWEIWNEPDNIPKMWSGDYMGYCKFYAVVAKKIKARFPHIKIGGPAITHYTPAHTAQFLDACIKNDAALDFFSWHSYTDSIENIVSQPAVVRKHLDEAGFTNTELQLNEWHYFPANWARLKSDSEYMRDMMEGPDGLNGSDGAAFLAAVLTGWQDTPLTMGCYYTASVCFGVFDKYGNRYKTYYGMKAFGEIIRYSRRVSAASSSKDVYILGGISEKGEKAILISAFKNEDTVISIAVNGVPDRDATVIRVDREHDYASETVGIKNGELTVRKAKGSAIFLIKGI